MVFAVSQGRVTAIERATYQAPTALRISDSLTEDYAAIYRAQPSVRTVVAFLARNIAQLSLHTFERVGETDRKRLRDHGLAKLLARPNSFTTPYRLMRSLVSDIGIYDFALWLKSTNKDGTPEVLRIPPRMVSIVGDNWLVPQQFILRGSKGEVGFTRDQVVYFHGYNPEDDRFGLSPIETLRRALSEEYAAGVMREQTLRNGARMSGYLTRPASNVQWSDAARARFREGWRAQYSGQTATEGGGTPILEDGMEWVSAGQSAVDLQYVESRKLTREEVASAYFIPPPMVGILDHATFGNIQEQHKMLYQDTLGPWTTELQQDIVLQLLPDFGDSENVYVEFNINEKLRGSFEEQAAQLQTSVGAPYMTRNEARARANLPAVEGGDELVVPLNVLIGGQASPTDSAPQPGGALSNLRIPSKALKELLAEVKARPPQSYGEKVAAVLAGFFTRQEQVVRSALGAKSPDWWNEERWDGELAAKLYVAGAMVTRDTAHAQLAKLGINPDEFAEDAALPYLKAAAERNAKSINAATRIALEEALAESDAPLDAVSHVFDLAKNARADQAGASLVTALAGFATVEAVNQVRGTREATKTWVVTSRNPRSAHAAMNGETVGIDDTFSNGAKWPGDSVLDVDDTAGCQCDVEISIE